MLATQQINFTGNLDQGEQTTIAVLDFSQGTLTKL